MYVSEQNFGEFPFGFSFQFMFNLRQTTNEIHINMNK